MSDERKKAMDVFNETNFVFSKKVGFDEAFPMIEEIDVEVKEEGRVEQWNAESHYSKKYFPGEYINCHNPVCYNGGFSIGSIIRDMVRSRKTELEELKMCQGNEASPKGRKVYRKCFNMFRIKVKIVYKEEEKNENLEGESTS